ncbi:hypothetical protein [Planosporangium mesophilum]|uniref:Uncharacterized protein n=1 Tax=Planosporangium mesophilum TaxID=689768 RepID=A0A8J3TH81_9ACTN|nr:hypothetical protein [Planosporangium mesophilum]NJC86562.1 hypothetical protein [Planosporangium mesophilum]GII26229.1 hypothetical protein Pme01_58260 [Planosporangium mesophilum]
MLRKRWGNRALGVGLGMLFAVLLVPDKAYAATGLYCDGPFPAQRLAYDFGSQTLTGGRTKLPGTVWTPYIYSLYGYDLSVYASVQGSGPTAELRHGAKSGIRSACKWNYLGGNPGSEIHLNCVYYAP